MTDSATFVFLLMCYLKCQETSERLWLAVLSQRRHLRHLELLTVKLDLALFRFLTLENCADGLSRNVGKESPLHPA